MTARAELAGGPCRVRWRDLVHSAEERIERGGAETLGCGEGERKVMIGGPGRSDSERGCANKRACVGTEADVWAILCQ